ncbi:MAG: hypothetical protein ACYC9S_10980 [Leptospirales bacterium]
MSESEINLPAILPNISLSLQSLLSLVKTNGQSRHGERPVSRIANGDSCHGEHPFLRGRLPVKGSQSGFYSTARKESRLESFSNGVSFEYDGVGVVDKGGRGWYRPPMRSCQRSIGYWLVTRVERVSQRSLLPQISPSSLVDG